MRALFRILFVSSIILFIGFTFINSVRENKPLEGPNANSNVIPETELEQPSEGAVTRPEKGLSTFVGKGTADFLQRYGQPDRIEPSSFGYDWWIYKQDNAKFMMIGVNDKVISQVYIAGEALDATPYRIGQTIDEIYRMTTIEYEVPTTVDGNIFIFSMSEKDMQTRILAKFEGLYAQLYIDNETGLLRGVRYTDGATLVMHQPYEMIYQGELIKPHSPSSFLQQDINTANANQLDDLVNLARAQENIETLEAAPLLREVARKHSEDMKIQNFLSHESPTSGDLKKRLHGEEVEFASANENLATAYFDAIEAMHGWLNSNEHRKIIFNEKYISVGSGVYLNYFTQIFVEPKNNKGIESEKETDLESEHDQINENEK